MFSYRRVPEDSLTEQWVLNQNSRYVAGTRPCSCCPTCRSKTGPERSPTSTFARWFQHSVFIGCLFLQLLVVYWAHVNLRQCSTEVSDVQWKLATIRTMSSNSVSLPAPTNASVIEKLIKQQQALFPKVQAIVHELSKGHSDVKVLMNVLELHNLSCEQIQMRVHAVVSDLNTLNSYCRSCSIRDGLKHVIDWLMRTVDMLSIHPEFDCGVSQMWHHVRETLTRWEIRENMTSSIPDQKISSNTSSYS